MEVAATVDTGETFVTYRLEGEGPLVLDRYEIIARVQASMHNNHHSNVIAVDQQLSAGNSFAMNQLDDTVCTELNPPRPAVYFTTQLVHSLIKPLAALKAAKLLNPQKVMEILPAASDADVLASFSFATNTVLSDLKQPQSFITSPHMASCT